MDKIQETPSEAPTAKRWGIARTRGEQGAAGVEYGLLVALIAAVIIGTVFALGGEVNDAFQAIVDGIPG